MALDDAVHGNDTTWREVARLIGSALAVGVVMLGVFALTESAARGAWAGHRYCDGVPLHEHVDTWELLDAKVDLARSAGDVDVLVLGDSSGLNGFVPEEFAAVSDLNAVNLATHGMAGFAGHRALLEEVDRRGGISGSVLLWIHPRTLGRERADIERRGFHRWLRHRIDDTFDRGNLVYRAYDAWGGLLRKRLRRRMIDRRNPAWRGELMEARGWLPRRSRGTRFGDREVEPHSDSLEEVAAIAELCRKRDVALRFLVMPVAEGSRVGLPYLARIERRLREAAPGASFVDTAPATLPRSWYADAGHLTAERAREFTRMMAVFYREHGAK